MKIDVWDDKQAANNAQLSVLRPALPSVNQSPALVGDVARILPPGGTGGGPSAPGPT